LKLDQWKRERERKMKKIDLHIHTVSTISDRPFTFSLSKLKWYVEEANLQAIAITNHNMFNLEQFLSIKAELSIKVFPGIEIDVDGTHILLISEDNDLSDFKRKCDYVTVRIPDKNSSITVDDLKTIFQDLSNYIIIPHYKKNPEIKPKTLNLLNYYITAGEVASPRKFIYCIKDSLSLVPVLFSDLRIDDSLTSIPARQTYLSVGDINLKTLKIAFSDKQKVHLSNDNGHQFFTALNNGLQLSTGLNVILGERSTGKSHTLNLISQQNDNEDVKIKYIQQFALLQRDEDDERDFSKRLMISQSDITKEHLKEFQDAVDAMQNVDLEQSEREIDKFITSLLSHAMDADKLDSYAKTKLFTESPFHIDPLTSLHNIIVAAMTLAENTEYHTIVNKFFPQDKIQQLIIELISEYNTRKEHELCKQFSNDLIENIKSELQIHTSATPIETVDLFNCALNHVNVDKFNKLATIIKNECNFLKTDIQGYSKIATRLPFNNARELGDIIGRKMSFALAFSQYNSSGYSYLKELRKIDNLEAGKYYKLFAKVSYQILNSSGVQVSGGERSEFRLLQEISDASKYDLLLIDEPESSFDNVFLYNKVTKIIKEIAKFMPVILVTHNNTVGLSILPDYLIYTRKTITGSNVKYDIFTGHLGDKELTSLDGTKINSQTILLNCLEAGSEPYNDRRRNYEMLEN
jgi:ABC-type dipeptide/oligopeptide/nickel transport system ATPase component